MVFRYIEFNFWTDFLYMPWFTSYSQLNMTYEFPWFHKNNCSTIKDINNLSTEMNYTDLITPQVKFQQPPLKDDTKHSFLMSFYRDHKIQNFGAESTPIAIVLKH